jgi:hypothetical protein
MCREVSTGRVLFVSSHRSTFVLCVHVVIIVVVGLNLSVYSISGLEELCDREYLDLASRVGL